MQHFRLSLFVTLVLLVVAFLYGGPAALFTAAVLAVLEVSFSFDNAVVNASILKTWDAKWRQLFLTVGMLVAVFGMRLLFPLLIVSLTTDLGIIDVGRMALNSPQEYANKVLAVHHEVAAFGGMFLLLVFLNFLLDPEKDLHWHSWLEAKMAELGATNAISVMISLGVLVAAISFVPEHEQLKVLLAGVYGIITYVAVQFVGDLLENEEETDPAVMNVVKTGSVGAFLYLEVLDASFSFDGVIGAFAITTDVLVILVGLTIGAFFVRSMTIYLVEKGTLASYKFLEHGAHYAIGALAVIMLVGMQYKISEVFTGFIGVAFIIWSVISSIRSKDETTA